MASVTRLTYPGLSRARDKEVLFGGRVRLSLGRRLLLLAAASAASATSCTTTRPVVAGSPPGAPESPPSAPVAPTPIVSSSGAIDYPQLEAQVFAELSAARLNPAAYASNLAERLPYFHGNLFERPGAVAIRTVEGAAAVREAIDALRKQPPVGPLTLSPALSDATRDLASYQAATGTLGHTGANGSSPSSRGSAHGRWTGTYDENVSYGRFASGRDVVVDLLIDDGVPERGHRRNIFDPKVRIAGVACGPHPRYGSVCVIDQTTSYAPR